MASKRPKQFESIASQAATYETLIPAPRIQPVTRAEAEWGGVTLDSGTSFRLEGVQAQLGQWLAENRGTTWITANGVWEGLSGSNAKPKAFPCHEKMKDKDRPYAAELKPHWERANKLGLNAQAEAIGKMALKKDIEELTKGAGYPEVTDRDLEAMFEFPRLRKGLRKHNRKVAFHNFWQSFNTAALKEKIVLRLKKDSVERSGVAIPFGAQLRLEEAKEKAIFESFQVVYPNVITESALAAERARERDPALVGIYQGSMFLICSWDLPKDIEKAETDIEALKALKIEG